MAGLFPCWHRGVLHCDAGRWYLGWDEAKILSEEEVMLAGRNIGTLVGVLTLIGLWLCLLPAFLEIITYL
jgi:hypothetical protein